MRQLGLYDVKRTSKTIVQHRRVLNQCNTKSGTGKGGYHAFSWRLSKAKKNWLATTSITALTLQQLMVSFGIGAEMA